MKRHAFLTMRGRQFGTLLGLLALVIVLWILTPHFLTVSNLLNIAEQTAIIAVIAAGMTFVIITAGIDLSVGSVLAFSGVVLATTLHAGVPLPIALITGIAAGVLCGAFNGRVDYVWKTAALYRHPGNDERGAWRSLALH